MPVRTRRLDRSPAIPAVCVTHGATVWLSTPAVNGPRVYIPSARKEATSSPTMSGPDTSAADSRVDRPAAGDREGRYFDPATGGGRDQTCASFVIRDQRQAGREGSAPDGIGAADLARWPRMATCGGRSRPRAPAFGRSRSVTRTRLPGVGNGPVVFTQLLAHATIIADGNAAGDRARGRCKTLHNRRSAGTSEFVNSRSSVQIRVSAPEITPESAPVTAGAD